MVSLYVYGSWMKRSGSILPAAHAAATRCPVAVLLCCRFICQHGSFDVVPMMEWSDSSACLLMQALTLLGIPDPSRGCRSKEGAGWKTSEGGI